MTQDEALPAGPPAMGLPRGGEGPGGGVLAYLVGFFDEGNAGELWVGMGLSWEEAFKVADEIARPRR